MKAIQRREKRWARRGRLLSLFGCLPLRTCMSLLRCPKKTEKERNRRMGEGSFMLIGERSRKWIEKRWARRGRQVQFLTVSHWSPVLSSKPGMIREGGRGGRRRKEKEG